MVYCPQCAAQVPAEASQCSECGAEMEEARKSGQYQLLILLGVGLLVLFFVISLNDDGDDYDGHGSGGGVIYTNGGTYRSGSSGSYRGGSVGGTRRSGRSGGFGFGK